MLYGVTSITQGRSMEQKYEISKGAKRSNAIETIPETPFVVGGKTKRGA